MMSSELADQPAEYRIAPSLDFGDEPVNTISQIGSPPSEPQGLWKYQRDTF